jgi:hypothetical protein
VLAVSYNVVSEEEVSAFSSLFTGREDLYADAETVRPVRQALTAETWRGHLDGSKPIGVFPLMDGDTTRWLCVDIDAPKEPELKRLNKARALATALREIGAHPYLERSLKKGYHCWLLFDEPVSARAARWLGYQAVLRAKLPPITEMFPAQESLAGIEVGNWTRLPFAGARVAFETERRCIVDENGNPVPLAEFLARVKYTRLEECAVPFEKPGETVFTAREGAENLLQRDVPEGRRHQAALRVIGLLARHGDRAGAPLERWQVQAAAASRRDREDRPLRDC